LPEHVEAGEDPAAGVFGDVGLKQGVERDRASRGAEPVRPPTEILRQSEGVRRILVDHEELYGDVVGRSQIQVTTRSFRGAWRPCFDAVPTCRSLAAGPDTTQGALIVSLVGAEPYHLLWTVRS